METLKERLEWAKNSIKGTSQRKEVHRFDKIYPFTTENISGYIDLFDLENKKLLTVGSSCDQIFNASLKGCKDITSLDVNPYTEYYYYFKLAALLELNQEEFIRFLSYIDPYKSTRENKEVFNEADFNKIKDTLKKLSYDSYYFWNELYNEFKGLDIRYYLFARDEYQLPIKVGCNRYLQTEENYNKTRKSLLNTNINFVTNNILDIEHTNIKDIFDNIWLSNIATYLDHERIKKIPEIYSKYLNETGKLLISYLYITNMIPENKANYKPIYKLSRTFELLQEFNPELISFIGINGIKFDDDSVTDSILVYKK